LRARLRQAVRRAAAGTRHPGAHQKAAGEELLFGKLVKGGSVKVTRGRQVDFEIVEAQVPALPKPDEDGGGDVDRERSRRSKNSPQRRRGRRVFVSLRPLRRYFYTTESRMDNLDQSLWRRRGPRLLAPWRRTDGTGATLGVVLGRELVIHESAAWRPGVRRADGLRRHSASPQ